MKIFLVSCVVWLFMGPCTKSASNSQNLRSDGKTPEEYLASCKPLDYGNGEYYLPCTQATFGHALSAFIETHKNLTIVSFAPDVVVGGAGQGGYFIITRPEE